MAAPLKTRSTPGMISSSQDGILVMIPFLLRLKHNYAAIANGRHHVCHGSLADIKERQSHVRFTPESRHSSSPVACPLSAISGHVTVDRRLYFFGGGATFSSHQSNLVEPSFASLPGMSEFSLSLAPEKRAPGSVSPLRGSFSYSRRRATSSSRRNFSGPPTSIIPFAGGASAASTTAVATSSAAIG